MPDLLPLSLSRRHPARVRPQLDRVTSVLDELGTPQHHLSTVLVVGTNGKGSTAAMLEAIVAAHGLRCGVYTSPHLVRVEERIAVGGHPIASGRLERLVASLDRWDDLTFFECLTVAALVAFAEDGVDLAVLEAGMGGRWDATRAAASAIVGLTNVGTDHRRWLGPDREAIAADKGAALAAARRAVLGPGFDNALRASLAAPRAVAAADLIRLDELEDGRIRLHLPGAEIEVEPPLTGGHQRHNLHLAAALARAAEQEGWIVLDPAAVAAGIGQTRWPGRLSRHRVGGRSVLLDGAHNAEAAGALAAWLRESGQRPNLLFSCLEDKPLEAMAAALRPEVADVVVCGLPDERGMPLDRLQAAFPEARVADDPISGLACLADPVLAAGSLRLVGTLLAAADPTP